MNNDIPQHVAIIPDGNRRWARKNGLPRLRGHELEATACLRSLSHSDELGVRYVNRLGFLHR